MTMWVILLFAVVLFIGLRSAGDTAADTRHAAFAVALVIGYTAVTRHLL